MAVVNYTNGGSAANALANQARPYGITPSDRLQTEQLPMSVLANLLAGNLDGVLNVKSFGAVGDGVTDDTAAIQACLTKAAQDNGVAYAPAGTYLVSTINVPNGVKAVEFGAATIKGNGTAGFSSATMTLGSSAVPLENAKITVTLDQTNGDLFALRGAGTTGCLITGCRISGFIDDPTLNHYAIFLSEGASYNIITDNHITGYDTPTQRGFCIDILGSGVAGFGGYFTGTITRATNPAIGNIVTDNVLIHGSYAVNLLGAERTVVANNYCFEQDHRSIYLAEASWYNVIANNQCHDFRSSAVVLGYGSSYNQVRGNFCTSTDIAGEATFNLNTGAQYNMVEGNQTYAAALYGVYLGPGSIGNVVQDNHVENFYLAGIALENDWVTPRPTNAFYSKPSYSAPPTGSSWSFQNASNNVIKNNVIGTGYSGRNTAAIALAQIDAAGATSLTDNTVQGNHVTSATNIAYNLFFYADTPSKFTGAVVSHNNFNPGNTSLSNTTSGATTWSARIAFYSDNREFDRLVNAEAILFADGDTTPSITTNSAALNERLYSFASYTSPTNVTDFDDSSDSQVITLRLSSNVTIVHNSSLIRLKGAVNVVGSSTNEIIQLVQLSGVWFETWRNF